MLLSMLIACDDPVVDEPIPSACALAEGACLCDEAAPVPATLTEAVPSAPDPRICDTELSTCSLGNVTWSRIDVGGYTAWYGPDGALSAAWTPERRCEGVDGAWFGSVLGRCDTEGSAWFGDCEISCDPVGDVVSLGACDAAEPLGSGAGKILTLITGEMGGGPAADVAIAISQGDDPSPEEVRVLMDDGSTATLRYGVGVGRGMALVRSGRGPALAMTSPEQGGYVMVPLPLSPGDRTPDPSDAFRSAPPSALGAVAITTVAAEDFDFIATLDVAGGQILLVALGAGVSDYILTDSDLSGGSSLAAGDVNGDDVVDMLLARPDRADNQLAIIHGPFQGGRVLTLDSVSTFLSGAPGVGESVAWSPDLTGDGLADVIVGGGGERGGALVVLGPIPPNSAPQTEAVPGAATRTEVVGWDAERDGVENLAWAQPAQPAPDTLTCWSRAEAPVFPTWRGVLTVRDAAGGPMESAARQWAVQGDGFGDFLANDGVNLVVGTNDAAALRWRVDRVAPCVNP